MQLRIKHSTGYRYEKGAVASFNEARMTPLTTPAQQVLRSRLDITPTPWTSEFRDYWGTTVTAFEVTEPHTELSVVATSLVETEEARVEPQGRPWSALAEVQDDLCEYLELSDWVVPSVELKQATASLRETAATPTDFARAVCTYLYEQIRYVTGATEVTTRAADAWDARVGVCQDFAHLSLGLLRDAGIPARYVSGYLHPGSDPAVGEEVEGESHAWIEWWDGDWVGYDPTNDRPVGEQHVVVARGRDYEDVPPLRGIYSTRGDSELFVTVEITRMR
ncbi:transglutaminase family protein [Aeromicrobium terrae]|nr:transglutaminase family protein [Aeromicrobium terrae]